MTKAMASPWTPPATPTSRASLPSADFPTTAGAFQTTYGGGSFDAFVTKLNPTGTALVYSTYLGGTSEDFGEGIAVDTAGNAYVTGSTTSTNFPTTAGAFQTTYGGGDYDAFVTKLNPTGTALVYSTYLGGTGLDEGSAIAVDTAGNAYVTGTTSSADFPTTAGALQTTYGGGDYDAFVAKFALGSIIPLTVNTLTDDPSGPTSGYTTLRDAIAQADADTANQYVINFALTGTIDLTSPLPDLSNNIDIEGPGALDLTVQRDTTDSFPIFTVYSGMTVGLYGMTIAGGNGADGGGIDNFGTLTVGSSTFTRNSATNGGGGIFNELGSTATISNSIFTNNYAGSGGSIFNYGTVTVSSSSFTGNSAGAYGGGLDNEDGEAIVTDCIFTSDSAGIGGGLANVFGRVTVSGTAFTSNFAIVGSVDGGGIGGGIANDGALTVSDSTFTGNSASNGGGVYNFMLGTATVSGSTFSINSASGIGGGLYNGGTATVTNSTFTSNSAVFGGGIDNYTSAILTEGGSTFTSNSATFGGDGGGLSNYGTATVSDSTFFKNSADSGGGIENGTSGNGSLIGTVTVTNSTFTDNSATGNNGGGIANGGMLVVSGSSFTDNSSFYGGGLSNYGTATVKSSTFASNTAVIYGGGIFGAGTSALSGCSFTNNSANFDGGGIYNDSSGTATVKGSSFIGNSAADGGGIFNLGTLTVDGTTFASNSVVFGGGIDNEGTITVTNSTFTDNSAIDGGGIDNSGTLTVSNSVFSSNSARGGGGLENEQGCTATVINSTFTGNDADAYGFGGGGLDNFGTLTVTNCTVSGNTNPVRGGIYNGGGLTLRNTIVAGNSSTSTSNNDISGQVEPTSAFNLIGDGSGISNLTDLEAPDLSNVIGTAADPINPLLAPRGDYGGPTQTMALLPGSPAIDAGSNVLAVDANGNPLTTDQRGPGFPRVVNGTVDIGAFESQGFTLTPVTGSTPQGTPVNSPFANPLAVIVTANNPLEPVAGGVVIFAAPASGASAILSASSPVTIGSNSQASVTASANAVGGQYTVTASTAGAAAPAAFALTNQFLSQTISFGPLASQTYGVAPITLNATATSGLPVSFTVISGPATLSGSVLTVTGAGTVEVEASQLGNATYAAATPVDESFTVSPASLTVTATGESMTYGGTAPALTYTYSGLVNGDSSTTFRGGLATSATSSSNVGNYPITVGNLVATGNYTIGTFKSGTLMVNAAPLMIMPTTGQSMIYGATVPALTYTVERFRQRRPASLLTGALERRPWRNSGGRQVSVHIGLPDGRNELHAGLGSQPPKFAITPARPTITWVNPSAITYGTALSKTQLDATATWTVGGKTVKVPGSFTYNPAAGTILGAGNNQTLLVSFIPTDTSDYTNSTATASLNVTQHATTASLVASTPAGAPGQTITFTATVAGGLPSPYLPTGSVQFQVNGVNVGSPVLLTAKDAAAFSMTEPASGPFIVTAIYSGDANFTTSKSPACTESVMSPGVYAVGSTLYVVGANSNDYALISPRGSRFDGSTGLAVAATLNNAITAKTFNQSFTAIDIFGYGGNDNFQLFPTLTLPTTVVEGNGNNYLLLAAGNDSVTLGSGSNQVFGGNGNKSISASDAVGTRGYVSLGNGNDNIQLGNGSDVIVEGNGNDYVSAGNGSDLVVGGLGQHTIQLGNGNDILIDGSATVVNLGDSLRQILSDWNAGSSTLVNKRLKVVYNTTHPNVLKAGSGRDWWFYTYSKDVTNKKPTDRLN